MALVLVEGEDKLLNLVGNATSDRSTAGQTLTKTYWTALPIAAIFGLWL